MQHIHKTIHRRNQCSNSDVLSSRVFQPTIVKFRLFGTTSYRLSPSSTRKTESIDTIKSKIKGYLEVAHFYHQKPLHSERGASFSWCTWVEPSDGVPPPGVLQVLLLLIVLDESVEHIHEAVLDLGF